MRLGSVAGAQGLCVNRRPQVPVMVMKAGGWTVLSEMFQVFELSSRLHHTTVVERSDFDATAPDGPNVTGPPGGASSPKRRPAEAATSSRVKSQILVVLF
jgi:hypothetical protein